MTGPKERLIASAIQLICERGVAASGLADLLSRSRCSRNSLYQHFPKGKSELVEAAVREAGALMSVDIGAIMASTAPSHGVSLIIDDWKRRLSRTNYAMGCPIMGAALAESEPAIQGAAADAFKQWRDIFRDAFVAHGLGLEQARSLSGFVTSAIEGAIVQSRASKNATALDQAQTELIRLLECHFAAPSHKPVASRPGPH